MGGLFDALGFGGGSSSTQAAKVWKDQIPYLQGLYRDASTLAGRQMRTIGADASRLSAGLLSGNSGYAVTNPYVNQQIAGFGQDLGNFFQNQVLPGIQSSAGIAGQFGGSRQGVAAGLAGQDLINQFSRGATDIRSNAYGQTMQNLPNLFNIGMAPYTQSWMPLQNLSASIGPPTVLGGASTTTNPGFFNSTVNSLFSGLCALAQEAFGPGSIEWVRFFWWKETRAPWAVKWAYNLTARPLARLVRGREKPKALVRRIMRRLYA